MKFSHKVFDLIQQDNERNLAARNSTQILRLLHKSQGFHDDKR